MNLKGYNTDMVYIIELHACGNLDVDVNYYKHQCGLSVKKSGQCAINWHKLKLFIETLNA